MTEGFDLTKAIEEKSVDIAAEDDPVQGGPEWVNDSVCCQAAQDDSLSAEKMAELQDACEDDVEGFIDQLLG